MSDAGTPENENEVSTGEIQYRYGLLLNEISKPEYGGMDDDAVAAAVNAKTVAGSAPIPGADVRAYFDRNAITGQCKIISEDDATALALCNNDLNQALKLRALCANICESFANSSFSAFNLDDEAARADCDKFIDALVLVNIMTAEQKTALYALADIKTPWTVAVLDLPFIQGPDVEAARGFK